jgi:Fe-S-cluster containining protein
MVSHAHPAGAPVTACGASADIARAARLTCSRGIVLPLRGSMQTQLSPARRCLSRSYPSRRGDPHVSWVDARIFSLRFFARCMECTFCHDACCARGCDADLQEVRRIELDHGSALAPRVASPRGSWFAPELHEDADFQGGQYRSSRVLGRGCVFLEPERGCKIHAYAIEQGLDYHDLKPWLCWLFPLTVEAGELCPQASAIDRSLVCSGQGATLYRAQRGELLHMFGPELVRECDALDAVEAT